MKNKYILAIFIFSIVLCRCSSSRNLEEKNIVIFSVCKKELPKNKKFTHVLNESSNTSTVKLSRILFDYTNRSLTRKKEFNQNDIIEIQKYYNLLISDISRIFFSKDEKGINLVIKESLNPSTSCKTNTLRVTPYFLQILFEESLKESIKRNREFFDDKNSIKTLNDYFALVHNNITKEIEFENNIKDESIALEFQRTNIFVSYEIMKAFTFIFGHELCHFFTECELGHQFEYDSDLLGISTYQLMNLMIYYDYKEIARCYIGEEFTETTNSKDSTEIVGLVLGSDLKKIVERIYQKTDFEKESLTHPPLGKRLEIIEELMERGDPDEIFDNLIQKKILKLTSDEESIYYRLSSGGNFIFNANWLFPKSDK